ncbi:MAG: glycoside hydrolase family 130 protein [Victivallaceae bacterium]|nr:glycoside hydrolase family 130 protein [Victivallaceae bacterium]
MSIQQTQTNALKLTTENTVKRCFTNPVLSAKDIPYSSVQIYNAGVTKFQGKYVMVFRNDYDRTQEDFASHDATGLPGSPPVKINIGIAFSDDGLNWDVAPKPCFELEDDDILGAYDPRLTVIDGRCYMCFAVDTRHGIRGGIAVTDDFDKFEILTMTVPDNRNMVLFPEKINNEFVRLERPFPVYGRYDKDEAFDIWMSSSFDCKYWGNHRLLLGAENVPFSNSKIGPAAPPVKTEKGWLTTIHAVEKVDREIYAWHRNWNKVYYGGIMLLDLEDPGKIIGMCNEPILKPEEPYELEGMRGEVIFPGGMILEDSGEVKIYYGAADTVECLATAHVDDLLKLCGV